jgi:hypothetical protein
MLTSRRFSGDLNDRDGLCLLLLRPHFSVPARDFNQVRS